MAVTKIRKVSSYTLLILSCISVLIFFLFFLGGSETDAKGNTVYEYTGILLFWTYTLFLVTVCATLVFACKNFASTFQTNSRGALVSIGGVVAFLALLAITYAIGSGEPIKGLNEASQSYNTSGWLKVTDMWLYSTYVLFILTVGAAIWGGISKALKR
nr:hypothetical protein [uncultured Porphyromonas sp.]